MVRLLVFAYGVFAYLVFFGTFLYALGFVGNWVVLKSIDGGRPGSAWLALLVNCALLGLFAVQHSVMARGWFKAWLTRVIPRAMERSTYVLVSPLCLILLFWLWQPLPTRIWHVQQPIAAVVLAAVSLLGWGIVLYGSFLIDHFDLFGLKQVMLYARGRQYTSPHFMERSLYKVVRHPLMLGFFIAFWFTPTMTVGHLLFAILTTVYILVGIQFEERDLVRGHGEAYAEYQRRVPALLPSLKQRSAPPPTERS
jgi:protein-S-isoprenylcysteine O-methyltransferase Ste14